MGGRYIKNKLKLFMSYNKLNINDNRHPYRILAKRIIGEVVEIQTGTFLSVLESKRMEDDIVALLTNLE